MADMMKENKYLTLCFYTFSSNFFDITSMTKAKHLYLYLPDGKSLDYIFGSW
jgi:hypothetical protein